MWVVLKQSLDFYIWCSLRFHILPIDDQYRSEWRYEELRLWKWLKLNQIKFTYEDAFLERYRGKELHY